MSVVHGVLAGIWILVGLVGLARAGALADPTLSGMVGLVSLGCLAVGAVHLVALRRRRNVGRDRRNGGARRPPRRFVR